MPREEEKRPQTPPPGERPAEGREEPGRDAGTVPPPEPEEAPELLGERSDYPIAWDDEER